MLICGGLGEALGYLQLLTSSGLLELGACSHFAQALYLEV